MNALQTAIAMVFAGLLSAVVAYIVDAQAQMVFQEEVRSAANALLDSLVNQLRMGVSTALLPGVYKFTQSLSLPSYSPPFDAFYYTIKMVNKGGVLYVEVNMTAYRGHAVAYAAVSRAVFHVSALSKPEGRVLIYGEIGSSYRCDVGGGWVDLTSDGCYTLWVMPSPETIRSVKFEVQ